MKKEKGYAVRRVYERGEFRFIIKTGAVWGGSRKNEKNTRPAMFRF